MLFLLTLLTTAVVDWSLKVVAHVQDPPALGFHAVAPPTALWLISLTLFALTAAAAAMPPARTWSWTYGSGLAWGGAVANMAEIAIRGGATNFIPLGGYVANPADLAIFSGLALWWGGLIGAGLRTGRRRLTRSVES